MRCDLLEAASSSSSCSKSSSTALDSATLWQDFLSQMPASAVQSFRSVAAAQQASELRTGPGGDLEFAWWAAKDLAGAAGKSVVKAHMEAAKDSVGTEPVKEKEEAPTATPTIKEKTKKSGRHSSSTTGDFSVVDHDDAPTGGDGSAGTEQELAVPTPAMETMRSLLKGYLEQIKGPLQAAKAQKKQ
jgi:hypothetical protein